MNVDKGRERLSQKTQVASHPKIPFGPEFFRGNNFSLSYHRVREGVNPADFLRGNENPLDRPPPVKIYR